MFMKRKEKKLSVLIASMKFPENHICRNISKMFMKAKEITNVKTVEKNILTRKTSANISNEYMEIMLEINNALSVVHYFLPKKY